MSKKRENLLDKIVQKDYSNELEKIIETKDFDEEVKNLLLSIFYKIDVSYKDYKKVKRNIETKQEYTEKLINIIQNDCNEIKTIKPNSKQSDELGNRTFLVDRKNKKIICYPVERKLLYSISKIAKQEKIIRSRYFLINRTISDMVNIGNNINTVEPLRDFNGWSWLIIKGEIENISYNLVYQNLRILVGEKFLNSWISNTEYLIDYYNEFQSELTEKFGTTLSKKIVSTLERLSIILELEVNPDYEKLLREIEKQNEEELAKFQNNQEFVEKLTEDKKKLNKEIEKIEKILSSKSSLEKEYIKENKELPDDKKIFSIKILEDQLKAKKQELLEQLEEKNELLNPKKFIEEKIRLEKIEALLQIINIEDKTAEKVKELEELQKLFLQCFIKLINDAETKEKIVDLIYILRYYNLLPFDEEIDIYENKGLQRNLKKVKEQLIKKAIENKVIDSISQDEGENIKILQFIFQTKIISLEDIYITVSKEKGKYFVEFSENTENLYEEKFEANILKKEKLNIKLNKEIKVLN